MFLTTAAFILLALLVGLALGYALAAFRAAAQIERARAETERAKAAHDYVLALSRLLESAGVPEQFDSYAQRADVRLR